jgi:hypothetical protein
MTDEDLWRLFVQNRERCSREFWVEVENRKAAEILSETNPFWGTAWREIRRWSARSNVVQLTPEEWEARKRRKMFRLISARLSKDSRAGGDTLPLP